MPLMTSGRVSTRRSLSPLRSRGWAANRWPRKSASVRPWRCTIVPIAPSRTRIRSRRMASSTSRVRCSAIVDPYLSWRRGTAALPRAALHAARNRDGEGAAGFARPELQPDVPQARPAHHGVERLVGEAEPVIAEAVLHPGLVVRPQVEQQRAAARPQDPHGLGQGDRAGWRRDGAPGRAGPRPPRRPAAGCARSRRASRRCRRRRASWRGRGRAAGRPPSDQSRRPAEPTARPRW